MRVDVGRGLPAVHADRGQLERVLLDLLSNAVKFTRDGGEIEVTAREVADSAGRAFVEVVLSDTGLGIPDREQRRLFSRFFRSSLSLEHEIQGSGLGLSLAKAIIDQHHGQIEVSSVEGEGTTVRLRLPVH